MFDISYFVGYTLLLTKTAQIMKLNIYKLSFLYLFIIYRFLSLLSFTLLSSYPHGPPGGVATGGWMMLS